MEHDKAMFIKTNSPEHQMGWLEVICGGMFSGKTEELIRRLRRAQIANQKVMIYKPQMDTRYSEDQIVSHNSRAIPSTPVSSSQQILLLSSGTQVVGVDEAQFFDEGIVEVVRQLCNQGIRVIAAGLDMDYTGKPFGPMPDLLAQAEFVTKVHAICQQCGRLANYSYRLKNEGNQVLVGEKDLYEPRCRECFFEEVPVS